MAIKGKTFDLQTITAKDDGALYRILSGESDMIVFSGSGTALSINSNILTIAECYLLVGGRYIHIEDGSTIDLGTIPNSSNRGRVILQIDTSLGATQVTLDQVVTEIETIASGGSYRALVKNDINSDNGGSVYEIEFATFTCSSGVASSPALTTSVPTQSIIQTLQDDIDTLADNLETTGEAVGTLQTDKANAGLGTPSEADCNNITTAGWYWINPSTTTSNLPSSNFGILEVTRATGNDNGIILQRFTRYASGNLTIFERMYSNNTWTSWHQLTNSPVPIANGGTGASTIVSAQSNLGISYGSSGLSSGTISAYADALANKEHRVVLGLSGQSVTDLPNNATCTIEIFKFDANSILCRATMLDGTEFIRTKRSGTWGSWHKMKNDVPDIVQFYIDKSSYSHFGYANLQITTRTNISGDTSFTGATTDYWNIQLNPGIYRMNLYCSFQSSSAVTTDVGIGLGNNANRRATPIEARVQTTGSITKLNASGVLKVTSYNDLYSFLIYMGDTTARDIGGYWTIERIGQ